MKPVLSWVQEVINKLSTVSSLWCYSVTSFLAFLVLSSLLLWLWVAATSWRCCCVWRCAHSTTYQNCFLFFIFYRSIWLLTAIYQCVELIDNGLLELLNECWQSRWSTCFWVELMVIDSVWAYSWTLSPIWTRFSAHTLFCFTTPLAKGCVFQLSALSNWPRLNS